MSSTLGIGVPVPKMLRSSHPICSPLLSPSSVLAQLTSPLLPAAITGTWTIPFATYFLFLSNRIVYRRLSNEKYFGDRLSNADPDHEKADPLLLDTRAQGPFSFSPSYSSLIISLFLYLINSIPSFLSCLPSHTISPAFPFLSKATTNTSLPTANFLENVPLALLFAGIAELNGADRKILNYSLAALLLFRIGHVELGLKGPKTLGAGRPIGYWGTQAVIAGLAGWGGWLVKGYWGF